MLTKQETPLRVLSQEVLVLPEELSGYQIKDLNPLCATKLVNGQLAPFVPKDIGTFIGRFGDCADLCKRLDLRSSNVVCLYRTGNDGLRQLTGVLIVILTLPTPLALGNLRVTVCSHQAYRAELEETALYTLIEEYATWQEWEFHHINILRIPYEV